MYRNKNKLVVLLLHTTYAIISYLIYTLGLDMSYQHFKSRTSDVIYLAYVTIYKYNTYIVTGVYVLFLKCCINTTVKQTFHTVAIMSHDLTLCDNYATCFFRFYNVDTDYSNPIRSE